MTSPSNSVQSIDRVLDILETLSSTPHGMLLSEIAAATGLHASTTHRLINVLVSRGYAVKDAESGRYRLTLRTFELGCRVSGIWNILSIARPHLDQLAQLTQETVHLVERDGLCVVYLYKTEPFQQTVRMASYIGSRSPMYCTGVGKSILANLPDEEIKQIWDSEEHIQFTDKTITTFSAMQEEVAKIRRNGYAIDDEEHEVGVRCIAVPIRNWKGVPVAAISVSAPAFRMDHNAMQRFLPSMLAVANEISTMLGAKSL